MMRLKGAVFALLCLGVPPAAAQTVAPPGASACSGCHARAENAVMGAVHGREPAEIVAAMQAFRAGERPATVMDRIAKGFSDDEIRAIAAWLGAQR
jgi:cytochrome subunit of sulfide dehydrogenase